MFILRAAFWLGVVSLFIPANFAGSDIELPFSFDTASLGTDGPLFDGNTAMDEWCEGREAMCEVGEEAARITVFLADTASERVEAALEADDANR